MRVGKSPPFSARSSFRLSACPSGGVAEEDRKRTPKFSIDDEPTFIAVRLAKVGYFGGDPLAVLQARVDIVESIIAYEQFEVDYEKAYIALNTPKTEQKGSR